MANTKKLARPARKKARRKSRRALQALYEGMTQVQRDAFYKGDNRSLKAFVAGLKAEAAKAAAAPSA
jgi:hypothetical protein